MKKMEKMKYEPTEDALKAAVLKSHNHRSLNTGLPEITLDEFKRRHQEWVFVAESLEARDVVKAAVAIGEEAIAKAWLANQGLSCDVSTIGK
jgi:ribosomal protein L7Ae-like RNA K-turn-binding protein